MAKVKLALLARLEAKAGKEAEVESFLRGALSLVQEETATVEWFAIKMGPSTFGIFDVFEDEAGRQAHLNGRVAAALMANAGSFGARFPSQLEKAVPRLRAARQNHVPAGRVPADEDLASFKPKVRRQADGLTSAIEKELCSARHDRSSIN